MKEFTDYPMLSFKSQKEFSKWLEENHNSSNGIWIRLFKKGSDVESVTYAEAVEESLCYGWIDSLARKYDEKSYIQKFTPRRSKSMWSKVNIGHVERLTKEGQMKEAGLKEVERAKADGRWEQAYDAPSTMKIPADFVKAVNKNKKVKEFFSTLNKSNKFAIAFQLHNAKKPETRERRFKKFLEMMERGEKLY